MKPVNYTEIYNKYVDKWIAFRTSAPEETDIVGSGETLQEAIEEAKKRGINEPFVTRLPTLKYGYAL